MKTFNPAPFARRRPRRGQDDGLSVSVSASPSNPQIDDPVRFSAVISNPPAGESPSYCWELHAVDHWMRVGSNSTFDYAWPAPAVRPSG